MLKVLRPSSEVVNEGRILKKINFLGSSFIKTILIIAVFAVVRGITFLLFMVSKRIAERLKPALIKAISRIMGLILSVIAVQMLINGIINVIHEFPK